MACGTIVRGTGFGLVADIAIGVVGALIGNWLLPQFQAFTLAMESYPPSSERLSAP